MVRSCESCGKKFQAKRPTARFCTPACQKREKRAETARGGRSARTSGTTVRGLPAPVPGELVKYVEKQLTEAARLDSWQGQAAMDLASRIEANPGAPLSQSAAAHRELRAALAEAVKGAKVAKSAVEKHRDELAERRRSRQRA
jgi:hypothetical protein